MFTKSKKVTKISPVWGFRKFFVFFIHMCKLIVKYSGLWTLKNLKGHK